ncbi:MAG: hypothetical protein DRN68_08550, partial [Thaumarchaeota archaeon]
MRLVPFAIEVRKTVFPSYSAAEQLWSYLLEFKDENKVPPFSIASAKIYTVPEGYELLLRSSMVGVTGERGIASNATHKVWIVITTPGVLGDRYIIRTDALALGTQLVPENASLYVY